tara:strand:+ start:2004 stop:2312 length:309 start_codon:yes stop_codon:yes gene_type:complete
MGTATFSPTTLDGQDIGAIAARVSSELNIPISETRPGQFYGIDNGSKVQIEIGASPTSVQVKLTGYITPDMERRAIDAFGEGIRVVPLGASMPSLFGDGYVC